MKYLDKTIQEINEAYKKKEITPLTLVEEVFQSIENNKELNAYITLDKENAINQAKELENKEVDNILFGIPIAVKDNIITKDLKTTCASRMLENFIPIYDKVMFKPIEVKQSDFLYLSDDNLSVGVVVKTGDGGFNDDWDRVPMNFKLGDVVLVRDNVSTRVTLGQEDYYVVDDKFIMGKFESEDKLNIEDLKLCEGVNLFEEYEDDTIEGSTLYKVPMGDEDDISQTYQNMLFKLVKSDEVPEGIYYINRIDTEYVKFKNKTYFVAKKDRIMAKRAEN